VEGGGVWGGGVGSRGFGWLGGRHLRWGLSVELVQGGRPPKKPGGMKPHCGGFVIAQVVLQIKEGGGGKRGGPGLHSFLDLGVGGVMIKKSKGETGGLLERSRIGAGRRLTLRFPTLQSARPVESRVQTTELLGVREFTGER